MSDETSTPARVRWARLRFQIIGQLLATPPGSGELVARIAELAAKSWRHPSTDEVVRFSAKAIERWFYAARSAQDPIRALERRVPKHAGSHPSVPEAVAEEIRRLRRDHPRWSYKLVYDNLVVLGRENPALGKLPGYASVCRYMKHHGLGKRRRLRRNELEEGFVPRERRSFEVAHVHALWHFDFHVARRSVALPSGERQRRVLLGILDDHSRLCCHAQWYLDPENTESLVHGLCQAFQKRGLPRIGHRMKRRSRRPPRSDAGDFFQQRLLRLLHRERVEREAELRGVRLSRILSSASVPPLCCFTPP